MADQNSMQMNMGLMPGVGPQGMSVTPSPAQTAMMLSKQAFESLVNANQQMQQATQFMHTNPSITAIARQVQSQISNVQAGMTVTPPSGATGQFASPQLGPMGPGVSPMPQSPMMQTPFTPRAPSPMFQTAWEQEQQQRDMRADRLYSFAMQAPPLAGQGMAYGAAALAGARLGGRMGPMGGVLGAAGGMMAAGMSGVAQGVGQMASMPFQPMQQAHEMGAAIQRTSQNWVVGGQQPGLGRNQSIQMAQQVSQLAAEPGFQKQTGGMFNPQDLMQIMGRAGQAGIMDQSQDIQSIKQNLRKTAQTVKEFMELTNDPDVSSVIRTMGQLRDVGMTQMQMRGAAANLKMYSRSAGMSLGQMGEAGMAGVQAFGSAGLAPDAGHAYGMQAMSSARHMVASGAMSPRQLAVSGGVQGVAATQMQAQAGFLGMPSLAMAGAQFTPQAGWQMDAGAMQEMMTQGVGAKALMKRARTQMKEGYGRGGGEALAMWPLQQRAVSAQIAESMSPEETTLMRFRTAEATGREMGLTTTQGAFALGARRLYGEDTATQMMQQAASPEFWQMQRRGLQQRRSEIGAQQYAQAQADRPSFIGRIADEALQATGIPGGLRSAGRQLGRAGRAVSGVFEGVGEYYDDRAAAGRGATISRRDRRSTLETKEQRQLAARNVPQMLDIMERYGQEFKGAESSYSDVEISGRTFLEMERAEGREEAEWVRTATDVLRGADELTAGWFQLTELADLTETGIGNIAMALDDSAETQQRIKKSTQQQRKLMKIYSQTPNRAQRAGLAKDLGLSDSKMFQVMNIASSGLVSRLKKKAKATGGSEPVTEADYIAELRKSLRGQYSPGEVDEIMLRMQREGKDTQIFSMMAKDAAGKNETAAGVLADAEAATRRLHTQFGDAFAGARGRGMEEMEREVGGRIWGEDYGEFEDTLTGEGGLALRTEGMELAAMVVQSGEGDVAAREEELRTLYMDKHGSDLGYTEWRGKVKKRFELEGQGTKDALGAAARGKGKLGEVAAWGNFAGQVRPAKGRISRALEQVGGIGSERVGQADLFSPERISALVGDKEIGRLKAAGGQEEALGKILEDFATMTEDKQTGQISDEDYKSRREDLLSRLSGMGAGLPEEEKGPAAKGPEAERLKKAEDAMMVAQTEFTESLKSFANPKGTFIKAIDKFNVAVNNFDNEVEGE